MPRGEQQRREAALLHPHRPLGLAEALLAAQQDMPAGRLRPGVHIRAGFQQGPHDLRMPPRNAPHERRLSLRAFGRVHVRAVGEQRPHRGDVALAGGDHERCAAGARRDVRIAARRQQLGDHGRAAARRRYPDRRDAQIVCGVHVRAGADQQVGRLEVIQVGGPVEGGGAVALPHVDIGDIGVPPEDLAHPGRIAALDCLEQLGVGGVRPKRRGGCQQRDRPSAEPSRQDAHVSCPPCTATRRLCDGGTRQWAESTTRNAPSGSTVAGKQTDLARLTMLSSGLVRCREAWTWHAGAPWAG